MGQSEITIFIIIANIILLIFITGIIVFIFQYRKRRLFHNEQTEILQQQHSKELLATQLEMQTQTMQYIGREIHDNVGQKLTLASLYTQQLAYENKAPQVNENIRNIGDIINESLAELRQLSKSLTDDTINKSNIIELLKTECDKISGLEISDVHFSSNTKNISLPYETKSILLRLLQEFLQNSIKHASCKNIFIFLEATTSLLILSLRDDGHGFIVDKPCGNGIGLGNMKKRTEMLGGTFLLQSSEQGTSLQINIPITNTEP
jgi:signal transduction histidine kinase